MKKILFTSYLGISSLLCLNCSSNNDEESNYKEFERMPISVIGDWRPVNAATKVSLTFTEEANIPKLYISRSGKYFQGRPLYLKGGDGSFYFKFNGDVNLSKLNYKRVNNFIYVFNLEDSGALNFNEEFIKQ
ncbi:hypothetical protein [Chryseobacterium indologenes]|uniref:hypothetical protein n=1 Tax=Chryseobacterium indologenes TaxID=253 RepID=UPI00301857F9